MLFRLIPTAVAIALSFVLVFPLWADEGEGAGEGTIFTFWPLVDYRESPKEKFRNLSILGPLLKFQKHGDEEVAAFRPLFYRTENRAKERSSTEYLYPVASTESSSDVSTSQVFKLYQRTVYRKDEPENVEKSTMLFPFYMSGSSKKYGPYTSVFPFYGDIYERFWRDEYHYVMFPLYGRTVNRGTTTRNYLYPFFSTTKGEKESGYQLWPIYGESAKEGVYHRRFVLWPFFMQESSGLNSGNPTEKFYLLPFYAATDSPQRSSRHYFWPFFGYADDREKKAKETFYFWPFMMKARGEERTVDRYLPFYAEERGKESLRRWYMWPLYRHDELSSDLFALKRDRVLYFLYSDSRETWPKDGKERRKIAMWPIFTYGSDERGVSTFAFPAPIEPIVDREEIERGWSPLWRVYMHRWNGSGDSAVSFLWNLVWKERRGDDLAYEIFPLVSYRSEKAHTDLGFLKGLVRYREEVGMKKLSFFWLPFGFSWSGSDDEAQNAGASKEGSL